MVSWRKFVRRSTRQRYLIIQALILLPLAGVALAMLGLATTRALFGAFSRNPTNAPRWKDDPDVITQSVHTAARHALCGTTCLPRSLVLWTLLRRQGFEPTLRFGARRTEGQVQAHAWVELGATVLDPTSGDTQTFAPFSCTSGLSR